MNDETTTERHLRYDMRSLFRLNSQGARWVIGRYGNGELTWVIVDVW